MFIALKYNNSKKAHLLSRDHSTAEKHADLDRHCFQNRIYSGNVPCSLSCGVLTEFNYATLTTLYIFQKTVECKLLSLRLCHYELTSSAKALVLTVQSNLMTLLLRINLGH